MSFLSRPGVKDIGLIENIVIIYLVMMAYETEFSMIRTNKLKYDSIRDIYSETPDLVSFWVEFFNSQRRVKRVILKIQGTPY